MNLDPYSAIRLSLYVGASSTLVGLIPAIACAYILARWQFRGKTLISALIMLPLVLPPVVTGLLLLKIFGRSSALGQALEAAGWPIPFSLSAASLAALVVGFPLYVNSIRAAFEAIDPRLEALSWSLGVPPWQSFFRVTLPLAAPGIAAGAVLAFARGLGEFGATAILAGNMEGRTRTISLAVYSLLEGENTEEPLRVLILASISLSVFTLFGYEALNRYQRQRLY